MNTAVLRLHIPHPAEAQAALAPDDEGYIHSRVCDGNLELTAESTTAMGLLRTLDDAMACLRATGIE